MSTPDALRLRPRYGQFPTALHCSVRDQTRNRLAGPLLVLFVPAWYLLMGAVAGHKPLDFKLYATGQVLYVDGGQLTLISAGLNSVTMIAGFVVFDAVRMTLAFDRRLVFAGYRQTTLIGVPLLRAHAIRRLWRLQPHRPVEPPRARPGLGNGVRHRRVGRLPVQDAQPYAPRYPPHRTSGSWRYDRFAMPPLTLALLLTAAMASG